MKYEYKYLVGDIGEKANELWVEYPDVMDAWGKEAVRAWRTGYRKGYLSASVPIVIGGTLAGIALSYGIHKIKQRKDAKKPEAEFVNF